MKLLLFFKEYPALALACLTAYLYLCTYQYETGYLQEFDVSNAYLVLDLNTILQDSTRVLILTAVVVGAEQLLQMIFSSFVKKQDAIGLITRFLIKLSIYLLFVWMLMPFNGKGVLYMLIGILGFFALFVIWVLIKMLIEHIRKIPPPEINKSGTSGGNQSGIWQSKAAEVFFYFCYPFFICSMFGSGEASKQETFQVFNDNPNYVVIRKYGDELVCKDLIKPNLAGGKTIIVKLAADKPIVLVDKKLGQIGKSREAK